MIDCSTASNKNYLNRPRPPPCEPGPGTGGASRTPLFEMMLERPPHMYGQLPSGDSTGQPDENTGDDYEQLHRKYDSEDEFEIL